MASSLIMGCAMVAPLVLPNMTGMWIYAGAIGVGYGMFMSIDMALMTQCCPRAPSATRARTWACSPRR
jgi:hypothetical protein